MPGLAAVGMRRIGSGARLADIWTSSPGTAISLPVTSAHPELRLASSSTSYRRADPRGDRLGEVPPRWQAMHPPPPPANGGQDGLFLQIGRLVATPNGAEILTYLSSTVQPRLPPPGPMTTRGVKRLTPPPRAPRVAEQLHTGSDQKTPRCSRHPNAGATTQSTVPDHPRTATARTAWATGASSPTDRSRPGVQHRARRLTSQDADWLPVCSAIAKYSLCVSRNNGVRVGLEIGKSAFKRRFRLCAGESAPAMRFESIRRVKGTKDREVPGSR